MVDAWGAWCRLVNYSRPAKRAAPRRSKDSCSAFLSQRGLSRGVYPKTAQDTLTVAVRTASVPGCRDGMGSRQGFGHVVTGKR